MHLKHLINGCHLAGIYIKFFKNLGWSPETVMDNVANDVADWVQFMGKIQF